MASGTLIIALILEEGRATGIRQAEEALIAVWST
jgi:hypothetical protein